MLVLVPVTMLVMMLVLVLVLVRVLVMVLALVLALVLAMAMVLVPHIESARLSSRCFQAVLSQRVAAMVTSLVSPALRHQSCRCLRSLLLSTARSVRANAACYGHDTGSR